MFLLFKQNNTTNRKCTRRKCIKNNIIILIYPFSRYKKPIIKCSKRKKNYLYVIMVIIQFIFWEWKIILLNLQKKRENMKII